MKDVPGDESTAGNLGASQEGAADPEPEEEHEKAIEPETMNEKRRNVYIDSAPESTPAVKRWTKRRSSKKSCTKEFCLKLARVSWSWLLSFRRGNCLLAEYTNVMLGVIIVYLLAERTLRTPPGMHVEMTNPVHTSTVQMESSRTCNPYPNPSPGTGTPEDFGTNSPTTSPAKPPPAQQPKSVWERIGDSWVGETAKNLYRVGDGLIMSQVTHKPLFEFIAREVKGLFHFGAAVLLLPTQVMPPAAHNPFVATQAAPGGAAPFATQPSAQNGAVPDGCVGVTLISMWMAYRRARVLVGNNG